MFLVTISKAEKPVPINSYMLHDDCYSFMKLASASANFDRSSLGFSVLLDCRAIEYSALGFFYSIRIVTPLSGVKQWPGSVMSSCSFLFKC